MSSKMFTGVILIIAIQGVYRSSGAQIKSKNNDPIIFPGPIQEVTLTRYGGDKNDIPDECKNKNFCTVKPADYPQDRFNSMFKNRAFQQVSLVQSDINDRQGDPEEIDNCETLVQYEPLYKVRTKLGDWRTVVQAPEKNYVQKVRTETCKQSNQACFTIFPPQQSYTTFCKQKFSTWEFVVESKDDAGKFETIKVDLPTCCSCHYKPI